MAKGNIDSLSIEHFSNSLQWRRKGVFTGADAVPGIEAGWAAGHAAPGVQHERRVSAGRAVVLGSAAARGAGLVTSCGRERWRVNNQATSS